MIDLLSRTMWSLDQRVIYLEAFLCTSYLGTLRQREPSPSVNQIQIIYLYRSWISLFEIIVPIINATSRQIYTKYYNEERFGFLDVSNK